MGNFTKWLVSNGYTTSEDKETIQGEISANEADELYSMFLNEGNTD